MFASKCFQRLSVATLLLAIFSTSATVSAQEATSEFTLRYKFVEGQSVYYEVNQKMEMQTTFKETKNTQKNDVWERKHYRVVKVEADGTAELETVIDQVKMSAQGGDRKIDYDSANPSEDIPNQFKGIVQEIGRPQVRVRMSSLGKLISLSRLNKDGKVGAKVSANAVPATDPSHNFLVSFPDKPMKLGSTWTEELTVKVTLTKEIMRDIKLLRTFELMSVQNGIATIRTATSIKGGVKNPKVLAQLIQRTPKGTIKFDTVNGRITEREMKTDESVVNGLGEATIFRAISHRREKLTMTPATTVIQ